LGTLEASSWPSGVGERADSSNSCHQQQARTEYSRSQQREPLLKSDRLLSCHPLQTDRSVRACQD
jgi:hypothetical protein